MNKILVFLLFISLLSCKENNDQQPSEPQIGQEAPLKEINESTFTTPRGTTIKLPDPSEQALANYNEAKAKYQADPNNAENIIWFGRRAGYMPDYPEAIRIFSEGVDKFQEDDRFYRHRGHRYISIREYELAFLDLLKASSLIEGKENEMEPDGAPNAQNIPVSSRHGNIWYHLGLAYYLKGNMSQAFDAFSNCLNAINNDDNIVSATHWLYMIQRRMGHEEKAKKQLERIHQNMNVIENHAYYELCKFYKGLISLDALTNENDRSQNAATQYGIANWHYYNGDKEKAKAEWEEIMNSSAWNSFGYIAAERDLMRLF